MHKLPLLKPIRHCHVTVFARVHGTLGNVQNRGKVLTMVVLGYLALSGVGFLWLMTRAPLWRAFEISIDHGLESGARVPGTLG